MFSKTIRWMKLILCIHIYDISLYINCVFFHSGRIRTLATYIFHRLKLGKEEMDIFSVSMGIFGKKITEVFIEKSSSFHMTFVQSLIACQGDKMPGEF